MSALRNPRVLIAVGGFPPAIHAGGPAVSLDNLCHATRGALDCSVVTSDHDLKSSERLPGIEAGWNARDGFRVRYLSDAALDLATLQTIVQEVEPDVLYLNSLFAARWTMPLLKIGRDRSIPVLLAPRGELCANALRQKKYKKIPYLFLLNPFLKREGVYYHATSDNEFDCIREILKIGEERIFRISEIPTLPLKRFERHGKLPGTLRCVFLSRIHPTKNLLGALEALANVRAEVTFDIYGPIEVPAYWDECQRRVASLPRNVRVHYRGVVGRDAIHETFASHDVFLFPTLTENYGHVIPEAMLADCPVILSDQAPWTDVNEAYAGWSLALDDMRAFTAALQSIADMGDAEYGQLTGNVRRYIQNKLKIQEITHAYVNCFEKITGTAASLIAP
ncbi:MAG: glycosyltransferase [Myxococcales bacterium]|jgi:glycosyltransferase involved in cell wall biosynthesis|nr:glycosyltransferase [Myxococcales bacterium]